MRMTRVKPTELSESGREFCDTLSARNGMMMNIIIYMCDTPAKEFSSPIEPRAHARIWILLVPRKTRRRRWWFPHRTRSLRKNIFRTDKVKANNEYMQVYAPSRSSLDFFFFFCISLVRWSRQRQRLLFPFWALKCVLNARKWESQEFFCRVARVVKNWAWRIYSFFFKSTVWKLLKICRE